MGKNQKSDIYKTLSSISRKNNSESILRYNEELGLSYKYAISIALRILGEHEKSIQDEIVEKLLHVFYQWQADIGVEYLIKSGKIPDTKGMELREISDNIFEKHAPWDCDIHATSAIKLLNKLYIEEYPPLLNLLKEKNKINIKHLIAQSIIITFNEHNHEESKECIEASLMIADIDLDINSQLEKEFRAHAKKEFLRKKEAKRAQEFKKNKKIQLILNARKSLIDKGIDFPMLLQIEGEILKNYNIEISVPTISRYLRESGIKKYN